VYTVFVETLCKSHIITYVVMSAACLFFFRFSVLWLMLRMKDVYVTKAQSLPTTVQNTSKHTI